MANLDDVQIIKNEIAAESIVFKGFRSGLTLFIPEQGYFDKYLQEVKEHLAKSNNFFRGAKIIIKIGNRILSDNEHHSLVALLEENGLDIQRFTDEIKPVKRAKNPLVIEDHFIRTITVKKTVRSGQKIEFDGNVLVWGDVNPGAEIVATGDVVVMGKLRGTVHAGALGDKYAKVFAFQLNPVQIRIAGIISRDAEKNKSSKRMVPEVAKIKDGLIVVEKYSYEMK